MLFLLRLLKVINEIKENNEIKERSSLISLISLISLLSLLFQLCSLLLQMHGTAQGSLGGLHHRLVHRGVGMNRAGDLVSRDA